MDVLFKKLQLKENYNAAVIHLPDDLGPLFNNFPTNSEPSKRLSTGLDFVLTFARSKKDIDKLIPLMIKRIKTESVLWICYPKKDSGIDSDLSRNESWFAVAEFGYRPVSQISIDDKWSAVRIKPAANVKRKNASGLDKYINPKTREITLPEELNMLLLNNKKANQFFNALSFTNKKEYVTWIMNAKKEETKQNRLKSTIEKLINGKKNPTEK